MVSAHQFCFFPKAFPDLPCTSCQACSPHCLTSRMPCLSHLALGFWRAWITSLFVQSCTMVCWQKANCAWWTDQCVHVCVQSCLPLCGPMDCSHQASLSVGFSRQEYWSGLPFPSPECSWLRDRTHVSYIGRQILYHWASREAHIYTYTCIDLRLFF